LNAYGFSESAIDGSGLIMADLMIIYEAEVFYGETLRIEIGAQAFSACGCDLVYRITSKETGKEVARAKTGQLFFDYAKRRVVRVPQKFMTALARR
jgi:acyl-CoA thioester hydrolase